MEPPPKRAAEFAAEVQGEKRWEFTKQVLANGIYPP